MERELNLIAVIFTKCFKENYHNLSKYFRKLTGIDNKSQILICTGDRGI